MTPCLLLSGFAPFGGEAGNPSTSLARALQGESIAGLQVVVQELPCEFASAADVLFGAIQRCSPRLVLAMGQAAGRVDLSFERVAINLIDARIADNAAIQPIDEPVDPQGPAAYFSTLPIKRMVAAARQVGVDASVSHSAGTFVCNQVFYALQRRLALEWPNLPGGFLHLPLLPEQAELRTAAGEPALPSMALTQMVIGLRAALHAAVLPACADDRPTGSEGSLH